MANPSGKNVRLILEAINQTQQHFDKVLTQIQAVNTATQQQVATAQIASAAIATLSTNNNVLAASLLRTTQQLQAQTQATAAARAQMQQHSQATQAASAGLGGLRSALFAVQAALAALGIGKAVEELLDANIQFQKIQNGFEATSGGPAGAAKEFAFVAAEAQRLGIYLPVIALEYNKLLAAGKPLGFQTESIRHIFTSVTQAAIVLGLSMDDVHGTLRAVQQMMSKGTVQAEELRGQLGERLPGAFALAAKAMGTTTAGLGKMLEEGKVLATDLLPKLADQLDITFGGQVEQAANATARSIDRLRTEFFLFLKQVGDAGVIEVLVKGFNDLNKALTFINEQTARAPGLQAEYNQFLLAIVGGSAAASVANMVARFGGLAAIIGKVGGALGLAGTAMVALAGTFATGAIIKSAAAFSEMRDALASIAEQEGRQTTDKEKDLRQLKSQVDLAALRRQTEVALSAEMHRQIELRKQSTDVEIALSALYTSERETELAQSDALVARYQGILKAIETQGVSIIANNQKEADRLALLKKQTAEVEKQVAEIQRRAGLLGATADKFKKEELKGGDSELRPERIKILTQDRATLQGQLSGVQGKIAAGVSSSDPAAAKTGVLAAMAALVQQEYEIRTKLLHVEKDLTGELDAQDKALQKSVDKAIADAGEEQVRRDQAKKDQQDRIELLQRERELTTQINNEQAMAALAARKRGVENNGFILESDRRKNLIQIGQQENALISERIAYLRAELDLNSAKPAVTEKDKVQNLQNSLALQKEINALTVQLGDNVRNMTTAQVGLADQLNLSLVQWSNNLGTTAAQIGGILTSTIGNAIGSISEQMTDLIFQTTTWGDAWRSVVSSVLRGLVQMLIQFGLQQAAMFIIRQVYGKASLAAAASEATAAALIWAPAATAASIATFGGAAGAGTAAFLASLAVGQAGAAAFSLSGAALGGGGGLRIGGYTGEGSPDEESGHRTHKKEFVLPEDVTSAVGVANLYRFMAGVRFGKASLTVGGAGAARTSQPITAGAPSVNVGAAPVSVVLLKDPAEIRKYLQSREGQSVLFDINRQQKYELGA